MKRDAFFSVVRQPVFDVPYAALLLAREVAYPRLAIKRYLAQLDELANAARLALRAPVSPAENAVTLATYLAVEAGFQGDAETYGDPRNSFLNDVLERRRGIPITLAIIFVAVARRLGLDAYGISLPGHFIAGVQTGEERVLLDPFHGGVTLTHADCKRLVLETVGYEGELDPGWLEPATPQLILIRMLNNLRMVYLQRTDWDHALVVLQKLHRLQPDEPAHLRDIGLIHYQQGDLYAAARCLESYLEQDPDSPAAMAVQQNLRAEFVRWAKMN